MFKNGMADIDVYCAGTRARTRTSFMYLHLFPTRADPTPHLLYKPRQAPRQEPRVPRRNGSPEYCELHADPRNPHAETGSPRLLSLPHQSTGDILRVYAHRMLYSRG